jgi:hypothetical protein
MAKSKASQALRPQEEENAAVAEARRLDDTLTLLTELNESSLQVVADSLDEYLPDLPDAAGLADSLSTGHAIDSHRWLSEFLGALRGPELALAQSLLLSR